MITYGNSRTKMVGIIRKVQEKQFTIQFPQLDHEVLVPFWTIHSPVQEDPTHSQEMEIDTWFLKKNRVLPFSHRTNSKGDFCIPSTPTRLI
jgi:hypothetical protein